MGLLSKIVKTGLGAAANWAKGTLNSATGGMAGVLGNKVLDAAHKHSGILGKVVGGIGRAVLNDNARNSLSKAADTAMKFIPSGKVKDTLSKINNAAQNRSDKGVINNYKSPKSVSSRGPPQYNDMVHTALKEPRAPKERTIQKPSTLRRGRL